MTKWKETTFLDAIEINPRRELKKGIECKFVSMDNLQEHNKTIHNFEVKKFSGGSKFMNKDTLMARITPCLENGKTAFVNILNEGEVAGGSTEFNVLSAREGKTIPEFVYYLSITPAIREVVIKSMTGTSGRQRVESGVFETIMISLPSTTEQKAISKILSDLDSKIELNNQMNATLEAMAQAIFKHWFIDFDFPDENGKPYKSSGGRMVDSEFGRIPEGWKIKILGKISENFDSERIPLSSRERTERKGQYPYYGATGILDYLDEYIFDGTYILMGEDGSVIDDRGYPILQYVWGKFWVNNHAHVLKGNGISDELLYILLKNTNVSHIITGAVQPKINQGNMNGLKYAIPDQATLLKISKCIIPMFNKIKSNYEQIGTLTKLRDSLLPKLMSGQIRVPVEVIKNA